MKIYLDMVGCRLNQSEIERFAQQFTEAGHQLTGDPGQADLAVVNTCTVTTAAAADSRKMIRRLHREGAGEVVVTGCWSTLEPASAADLPGVSRVIDNQGKDQLVLQLLEGQEVDLDREPGVRELIPGDRLRTRANIKVQDGCDHRCAFCVTTLARGEGKSVPIPEILSQIRAAERSGVKEVVLTGVQLGSWGHELEGEAGLAAVVRAVLQDTDIPRVRLSSLEPWDLGEDLIELLRSRRLAPHLHLPLQSGSDATLQRMGRKITAGEYADLVARVRSTVPEAAITTDVMAGFPGETDREFQESAAFVRALNFAGGHVFTYSPRPGTPAAAREDQVDYPVRKARNAALREILSASAKAYRDQFLGERLHVLWESVTGSSAEGWQLRGLSGNYLRVSGSAEENLWNQLTPFRVTGVTERGVVGDIIPS